MNEELQNALAEIITSALQTAETAKEFVLAELPDVVHQLLMWKLSVSIMECIIGLMLIMSVVIFWRLTYKKWDWIERHGAEPLFAIGGGVASPFIVLVAITELINLTWLQILIAPKIYLLEYASNLAK